MTTDERRDDEHDNELAQAAHAVTIDAAQAHAAERVWAAIERGLDCIERHGTEPRA